MKIYNPDKEIKVSIVFEDMIYDVIKNSIATELLDRNIKLNSVFIKKSYFKVPKEVRISCKNFLI